MLGPEDTRYNHKDRQTIHTLWSCSSHKGRSQSRSLTITEDKGTPHAVASTTHALEKSLLNQSHSGKRNECRRAVLDSRSCMESEGQESIRPAGTGVSRDQHGNASKAETKR